MIKRKVNSPLGLILTPSHDLTLQICSEAKKLSKQMDLKISSYIGGQTMKIAKDPPIHQVDLIIASLGVLSKLVTWNIYDMNYVRHIVLDEADVLLDPTFSDKLSHFIHTMPVSDQSFCSNPNFPYQVQLTLSSATIPENLPSKLHSFVKNNYLEPVVSGNQHQISVPQKFLRLKTADKPMELLKLIKAKIKITTDAGARGLDTIHVQQVINYDFPLISSEYIHRCGRTGRIGSPNSCQVINFISRPLEIILTSKIEFAIRKKTSIPMIDFIHNANEQDEFIKSNSDNNKSTNSSDPFVEPSYRIPQ
ncbi:PREDICTED: probable ATP-dependent RNA helicase DDX28 [Ceratosolen solmsi marchali]|uniref:RNA helicase n=1 Tax=Ceratosolen solmsi marchali TaxID=326594 RepID=A0AAJ6YU28_9HYME|nr:PREDICTED: probable ATP-dependent RNA helicase DDX28 [Ceratosolen solmsi marchali]